MSQQQKKDGESSPIRLDTRVVGLPTAISWPRRYERKEFYNAKAFIVTPRSEHPGIPALHEKVQRAKDCLGFADAPNMASASFIIVGDGADETPKPTEEAIRAIMQYADGKNLPIISVTMLKLYEEHMEEIDDDASVPFVLQEGSGPGMTLTMGPDFFRYAEENEDDAYDELGRQQLQKDEYVAFVNNLHLPENVPVSFMHVPRILSRERLGKYLNYDPIRLIGTRWKVHMVLNRYLALAWEVSGHTWTFNFHEENFKTEYQGLFGEIDAIDALRASVLAFLKNPQTRRRLKISPGDCILVLKIN
ncbi:hypothetical protein BC938DRAFT_475094 [Jimgerdemannia flammicorona]|uniref:Uncharacterized protein n=1 Tax=Jimgerdemannia flammicorona TaxID=994334 RepID=A0A433QRY4_9FUNG|nr:hypothetical protein BC938DRAFT_475094 [Jimgerdemannia flammicorona]